MTPWLRAVTTGAIDEIAGGMVIRGLEGENPLDPLGLTWDQLFGLTMGGIGGR